MVVGGLAAGVLGTPRGPGPYVGPVGAVLPRRDGPKHDAEGTLSVADTAYASCEGGLW